MSMRMPRPPNTASIRLTPVLRCVPSQFLDNGIPAHSGVCQLLDQWGVRLKIPAQQRVKFKIVDGGNVSVSLKQFSYETCLHRA